MTNEYDLMHRDIPVARLALNAGTGAIESVRQLWEEAHLPVGVGVRRGVTDRAALREWWADRAIPDTRAGLRAALRALGVGTSQQMLPESLGLNLADSYWIRPADSALRWADVNFYQNPFSEDMGDVLLGGAPARPVDMRSPDAATDGWLQKKWTVRDGRRILWKGGSGNFRQEPCNEVIASRLMARLNIPHVEYSLAFAGGLPYSICEDFLAPGTEYVCAWQLIFSRAKPNHVSLYQHYLERCSALGVPGAERALAQQITVDYLLVNEDRHQGNFGAVRRADTLEYLCPAPLFDTGSCLWFETPTRMIHAGAKAACKPFKTTHAEQLRLVKDFSWLDERALTGLGDIAREVFANSPFIPPERAEAIAGALDDRARLLLGFVQSGQRAVDDASRDVRENVAFSRPEA